MANTRTLDFLSEESVKSLQESLDLVAKYGFSLRNSSPTGPLLEAAIDLILILRRSFTFEESRQEKLNPLIKINENQLDELGNAKSVTIKQFRDAYGDPLAEEFFYSLASLLVMIKDRKPIKDSFMESFEGFFPRSPPIRSESKEQVTQSKENSIRKNAAYYRRQRKRIAH